MNNKKDVIYKLIEQAFQSEYDNLVRVAQRKLGNVWAEDCVMDVFERVLKAADRIHMDVDIRFLLRAALHNRIKDYLSQNITSVEVEEYHIYGGELENRFEDADYIYKARELVEQRAEPLKTALYLHMFEGVPLRKTSSITGVPIQTISMHSIIVRRDVVL